MENKTKKPFGVITALTIGFVGSLWGALLILLVFGVRDGWLITAWRQVEDGQAQIVSSAITALGLITSALLVPFIFKDRIRDLDGAVDGMKKTLEDFAQNANGQLDGLSTLFEEKLSETERRSSMEADRIGEVLEEIRAAVILSVSNGAITDPKHAKVFVQHLYNDAVSATQTRVREKPHIWATTRNEINELRTMSRQYLDRLLDSQIIDQRERAVIDQIKQFAYRRTPFNVSDIAEINRARNEFDTLFGENTISDADAESK